MDASNKRGTLVLYGEDITLRSGRHMIPLEERPVAFDKEKDKQLPRSWPRDPPPKLEQLAKRPGVTCTFRTRPAVLTISGITRADVEEIKDTLTNASPDLGAVHLEIYLRMHIFTTTCEDLNFFMWRFFEDGDEQGEQGRGEGGVGEESDSHNYSVCSASSATSDSSTTSRSPQSSPYCSPRTESGDARSTVSEGDSSGIGYSGSSGGSGDSGDSGSSGSSTGGVPSPERQETGPVVRSDTSTDSASSGHATPTREKEGGKPAMPDTTNNTTTATPATSDTPARAKEKLSEHIGITSSNSNSKSKPHQEDAGGSSSSSEEGENGKDRQSSPGEVHVDGDEVRVEVVPVDVEQLNGLMKLQDNEENFRIVGRAIRRALVWLGFTERVLFVATGPGAPFSADAVPAHLRSAVLDAVRTASGGDTEGRGTAGEGGGQQRGTRSADVGGGSNEASDSIRSEMSGDSSDGNNGSSVHGDSETEGSQGDAGAVEVCSGRPVFVLASTDEEALRCVRAKVDDALAAFRLNVPPHSLEVPGYDYLHKAKHDIEEHDDHFGIAEGCGLSIANGPLSLPEPWPKEMEHVEILILSWAGRVTVEEWRGLMTHLPKLKLLVCSSNFKTDDVQQAVLANPEERDLFLRTTVWTRWPIRDLKKSKLFADGDVVALRRSQLLHMLGYAVSEAARFVGHVPHFNEALSDGILAFGKVEEEDMVWGTPDNEWGSKEFRTRRRCPGCTWDRLFGFCSRCELYEYDLDTGTAPFLEELKANS